MSLPLIKPYLSKFLSKKLSLALLTSLALVACSPADDADTTSANANEPVVDASQTEAINDTTNKVSRETATEQDNVVAIEQPITILALGDSLTEGLGVNPDDNYPAQLEVTLKDMGYKNVKVINSGLSGETSTGLVNRLDWVTQTKPDITILTIGANDAIRGIDVATVEDNIRTAAKHLQDNGSEVILGGMQIYDNLGSDYVESFAAIYPRIAKDMNVTLIPFFLNGVGGDPELNQADAIHPTKDGYTIIVNDNILPILAPKLEAMVETENN
ncbi:MULTISPECIES: arylesterase [unclassified Psychrobacter]|uniref:arylesterase n=1 Tax=unclassified Psychrobacter TaxID=196806 RepID=UPI003F45F6D2